MHERPSASISLMACGIVSGYSPPCSMAVQSICGSCGRLSGVMSANLWVSFIRGSWQQDGPASYSTKHKMLDQKVSCGEHSEYHRDNDGPPRRCLAPQLIGPPGCP